MDITLYEMGTSRSLRCRWTLKEAGLEYKSIDDRSLLRNNELKMIHPLGKKQAAGNDLILNSGLVMIKNIEKPFLSSSLEYIY